MQMWQVSPGVYRPLFAPDPTTGVMKLSQSPECCCSPPALCTPDVCYWPLPQPPCPEIHNACYDQIKCLDYSFAPPGTLSDPCKYEAYLIAHPLDLILPAGFGGSGCSGECDCTEMDDEAITMAHEPAAYAFGNLRWFYDEQQVGVTPFCGPFPKVCVIRTADFRIGCSLISSSPDVYSCTLLLDLTFRSPSPVGLNFSYTYRKFYGINVPGNIQSLRLEDFDEEIPIGLLPTDITPDNHNASCFNPELLNKIRVKFH